MTMLYYITYYLQLYIFMHSNRLFKDIYIYTRRKYQKNLYNEWEWDACKLKRSKLIFQIELKIFFFRKKVLLYFKYFEEMKWN